MNMSSEYLKLSNNSRGEPAGLPEILQHRQERQSQDDEMIAIDTLEQLNAGLFQLIGADAGGDGSSHGIEVGIEKVIRKSPHGQARDLAVLEQQCAIPHQRDRGMELVGLAAQHLQLRARRSAISRLGKS